MQESPGFSSFRKLMDIWDEAVLVENKKETEKQNKVKDLIDGKGLIMFFRKGNSIFGAPEESRIVFARMMNPDEDYAIDDDRFPACDLAQSLNGNPDESLFSAEDMPKINIITRDEAENELMNCPCQ
ncbi:MAG: hypothetical protein GTO02_06135 [Candidatus Dadabacteria bacterium]|nr:hypothetical protein [Candidatus Dadabacteria bacterium]